MSSKSFDYRQMSNSHPPDYLNRPLPPNPVNRYPSSSSSTSTYSNREWTLSSSIPRSNLPNLPNLQNSFPSSSPSTWTPSSRQWTAPPPMPHSSLPPLPNLTHHFPSSSSTPTWTPASSPISRHESFSHYNHSFTQANPFPQSNPITPHFSPLRDFHTSSPSQPSSLFGNAPSATFQSTNLALPHFSSKNSFNDFSFPQYAPSNGGFAASLARSELHTLRNFMNKEMSYPLPRFLPTMEDRAFQTFQKAMNPSMPLSCSSTTISFHPPTINRGPLTIDVTSARFSNGVPNISTAKIAVLDTAVGIWNGTKQAFALLGLQQMEMSSQEQMEILDTMTASNQAHRAAFKEQMSSIVSSELHPVSIVKDHARYFVSRISHDIFQELAPLFVELSKYRPDPMFEDLSSKNFWDAPKELGHAAIDNFCQTHLAQRYLAEPLILITKCEVPMPWGFTRNVSQVVSAGTKALSAFPKAALTKEGALVALPKAALSNERVLATLPKVTSASERVLTSSANRSLVQLEKAIYDVFGKDSKLMFKISEGPGSILKIENIALSERQVTRISENFSINLNRFHQAARELSEIGQTNVRILRGWAKSKGWEMLPNPEGRPEIWGFYQNGKFQWTLKIKAEGSMRLGLEGGSNIPRFDARLNEGIYINPFTGEKGTGKIGTHILLEYHF